MQLHNYKMRRVDSGWRSACRFHKQITPKVLTILRPAVKAVAYLSVRSRALGEFLVVTNLVVEANLKHWLWKADRNQLSFPSEPQGRITVPLLGKLRDLGQKTLSVVGDVLVNRRPILPNPGLCPQGFSEPTLIQRSLAQWNPSRFLQCKEQLSSIF